MPPKQDKKGDQHASAAVSAAADVESDEEHEFKDAAPLGAAEKAIVMTAGNTANVTVAPLGTNSKVMVQIDGSDQSYEVKIEQPVSLEKLKQALEEAGYEGTIDYFQIDGEKNKPDILVNVGAQLMDFILIDNPTEDNTLTAKFNVSDISKSRQTNNQIITVVVKKWKTSTVSFIKTKDLMDAFYIALKKGNILQEIPATLFFKTAIKLPSLVEFLKTVVITYNDPYVQTTHPIFVGIDYANSAGDVYNPEYILLKSNTINFVVKPAGNLPQPHQYFGGRKKRASRSRSTRRRSRTPATKRRRSSRSRSKRRRSRTPATKRRRASRSRSKRRRSNRSSRSKSTRRR